MSPAELDVLAERASKAFNDAMMSHSIVKFKPMFDLIDAGEEPDGWGDELFFDQAESDFYLNYYLEVGDLSENVIIRITPLGEIIEVDESELPDDMLSCDDLLQSALF